MSAPQILLSHLPSRGGHGVLSLLRTALPARAWELRPAAEPAGGGPAAAVLAREAVEAHGNVPVWRFDASGGWSLPDPALFAPVAEAPTRRLLTVLVVDEGDLAQTEAPLRLGSLPGQVRHVPAAPAPELLAEADAIVCGRLETAVLANALLKPAVLVDAGGTAVPALPFTLAAVGPEEVMDVLNSLDMAALGPELLNWKRRMRHAAEARVAALAGGT